MNLSVYPENKIGGKDLCPFCSTKFPTLVVLHGTHTQHYHCEKCKKEWITEKALT